MVLMAEWLKQKNWRLITSILKFNIYLWKKSITRLVEQKQSGVYDLDSIKGLWPFLSYIKNIIIDFCFDAAILLCFPVGIIAASYSFVHDWIVMQSFVSGFNEFITVLVASYLAPIVISLARDILQLIILPFRKFIDWVRKPAQYLEINEKKQDIEK